MVIKKLEKPKNLEEYVEQGGTVPSEKKMNSEFEWKIFTLRIRKDLSEKINHKIENRIGITKTAWILEAIQDKLKND